MNNWERALILESVSIREAIEAIDHSGLQIALVVDEENHLLGTVTDGDVRRGILKNLSLNDSVRLIMNSKPKVVSDQDSWFTINEFLQKKHVHHIPIVDSNGCVTEIKLIDELLNKKQKPNWVVLMAGGIGSRLRPLTNDSPKPLLKVGKKPLLETILENFIEQGFFQFFISVNYKAEMIEDYFGDGSRWGVKILYLQENERMGTAGSISLLPGKPKEPLILMNGDLLTKVNFNRLLEFHEEQLSEATMCVREYDIQIPYGVAKLNQHKIVDIDEKPIHRFFVNAGIYVLEPELLKLIPENCVFDMTDFFEDLIQHKYATIAFPIREYWRDIGHIEDYKKVNGEFNEVFK